MKITFALVLLTVFSSYAADLYSQTSKLSLEYKNEKIVDLLRDIEDKSEFRFFYNEEVDVSSRVTLDLTNASINVVLENIFRDKNVKYEIVGRQIILSSKYTSVATQQPKTISGKVTDSSGSPLPGVTVLIKGTTTGTITDFDGNYSIKDVAADATLVFSFMGMKTQEILVVGKNSINIRMEEETVGIEEVVAVGYGVQKKREVTGAISQVKGDEISSLAAPSFETQLTGRSAGVQITSANGILGESPRIRIRGVGSISQGTYPLVVVDGMPIFTENLGGYASSNSMGGVNPSDIESIEILKDGSATAIYGSRAANGVILITTKKGKKGKFNLTYNNYMGVASPVKTYDLLDAEQFVVLSNEKRANAGLSAIAAGTDVNTDWQKAVLRSNAFQQDHALSLSGANDMTNYYFSLGYSDQEGISRPNKMSRFTLRANIDQKVRKWLTVGINSSVSRSEYFGLNTGADNLSGNILAALRLAPNTPIYDANDPTGYNISNNGKWENYQPIDNNLPNIRYIIDKNIFQSKILRVIASSYAMVNITKDLSYKLQANIDNACSEGFRWWDPNQGDGAGVTNGRINNNYSAFLRWNIQNIVNYTKTISEKHTLGASFIAEFQKERKNSFSGAGVDVSDTFFNQNLITGTYSVESSGGSMSEKGFNSFAGRLNYNYAGKYFVQASLRDDGISQLPKSNRYGYFPGFSVGWTTSKESFMSKLKFISDMKIRGSYAKVGNVEIGNYPYLGLYSSAKYADNNGIGFSQMGNDQLKWETSKKIDIGTDATFFDGRYKFTFDYFVNNQSGLIMNVPVPGSFGIPGNVIAKNIGSLKNWGYEFSVDAVLVSHKELKVSLNGNLSLVDNKVTRLVDGSDIISDFTIIREGESINSIYGYEYFGVNMSNGNPIYRKADGIMVQSDISKSKYVQYDPGNPTDVSVSASLSPSTDRKILGGTLPKYFGAIGLKAEYKDLDFSLMARYSGGNYVMNATRVGLLTQSFQNNGVEILGRWQSIENPGDGNTPRIWYNKDTYVNTSGYATTRWVEKGNFIKLQNIILGYTIPKNILDRIGIEYLRIFAQGQDLFMISKYSGLDPEMETNGVDKNGNPRQKVMTVGLSIKF